MHIEGGWGETPFGYGRWGDRDGAHFLPPLREEGSDPERPWLQLEYPPAWHPNAHEGLFRRLDYHPRGVDLIVTVTTRVGAGTTSPSGAGSVAADPWGTAYVDSDGNPAFSYRGGRWSEDLWGIEVDSLTQAGQRDRIREADINRVGTHLPILDIP